MEKGTEKQLFTAIKIARKQLSELSVHQRSTLEKTWDIEHAYYSSTLEGSKLDRSEFNRLGEEVQ
ncbi:MAG: hypothetical protein WC786_05020 [Patescibacteria group bacterium]